MSNREQSRQSWVVVFACGLFLGCGVEVQGEGDEVETSESASSRPTALYEKPWAEGNGIDFDRYRVADFDGDGVNDRVRCNSTDFVKIERSSDGVIWQWTPKMTRDGGVVRDVSRCAIVEIVPGYPSVVVSSFWWTPAKTRWRANQHVIFNKDGSRPTLKLVTVAGADYFAVGRAVSCTPYPRQLVDAGFNPGALCFFSGYHGDPALIKFEGQGDQLVSKDVTPASGLLWRAGVDWQPQNDWRTWYSYFPHADYCTGQPDGYFTIDAAMLDYDKDGLVDMVTVGQHASVRAWRMSTDPARTASEGVRYSMQYINNAKHGGMTEFIRADAFGELEPHLDSSCVYFAGEPEGCGGLLTKDHIRCYEGGSWTTIDLPRTLFSFYRGAEIRANGKGQVLIRTRDNDPAENVMFAYDYTGPLVGEVTHVSGTWAGADKVRIKGWACRKNDDAETRIIVRSHPLGDARSVAYHNEPTAVASSVEVRARCLQPGEASNNFDLRLDKSALSTDSGMLYLYAKSKDRAQHELLRAIPFVAPIAARNAHSGKCLDVAGQSVDNRAGAVQEPCGGSSERKWHLEPSGAGDGSVIVRSARSGKCLDVLGWSKANGARLVQWTCHGGANQRWRREAMPGGGFRLRSVHSGLCADVGGWSEANGARVIQWACHGGANQTWR